MNDVTKNCLQGGGGGGGGKKSWKKCVRTLWMTHNQQPYVKYSKDGVRTVGWVVEHIRWWNIHVLSSCHSSSDRTLTHADTKYTVPWYLLAIVWSGMGWWEGRIVVRMRWVLEHGITTQNACPVVTSRSSLSSHPSCSGRSLPQHVRGGIW